MVGGFSAQRRGTERFYETLTAPLQPGEEDSWGLGPSRAQTPEQIMDVIDRGNYNGGRKGREYFLLASISHFDMSRILDA